MDPNVYARARFLAAGQGVRIDADGKFALDVTVISEVFLAREIDILISRSATRALQVNAQAPVKPGPVSPLPGGEAGNGGSASTPAEAGAAQDSVTTSTDSADTTAIADGAPDGGVSSPTPADAATSPGAATTNGAKTQTAATDDLGKQVLESQQRARAVENIPFTGGLVQVRGGATSGAASDISLKRIFVRPVTIGYRGIRLMLPFAPPDVPTALPSRSFDVGTNLQFKPNQPHKSVQPDTAPGKVRE